MVFISITVFGLVRCSVFSVLSALGAYCCTGMRSDFFVFPRLFTASSCGRYGGGLSGGNQYIPVREAHVI